MDAVEDVRQRLSIEDVISEYVQLKRAGRNYRGLSPFTNEKTPSFMVSPEKQIWHDFSSGKGGNIFSFVMEMEGLDFRGALELLARKAGVDLSQYQTGRSAETGKLKERLYTANELAAKFYQVQFSKHKKALDYVLKERKFTKEVTLAFRLGYAPNTGNALVNFLKKQGFNENEIQKVGLGVKRYQGLIDMFRGRIMIPLQDPQGRIVGFTARLLDDEPNAPKYINTPQTILYDKSRQVYGLHLAKEAIRHNKYVVMVEGNLDVIASHQADIKNVVATAGTAMTEMHLKSLSRFTDDVRIAFDEDQAGIAATERAIPIAAKVGVSLSVITIPDGKDPDELIKKDPKSWQKVIESHKYALDWLIERYESQLDLSTAQGKKEFSDIVLRVISQLSDSVEQDHYVGVVAKLIDASKEALERKLRASSPQPRRLKTASKPVQTVDPYHLDRLKAQNQLLALTLMQPALRHYLEGLNDSMLLEDNSKTLLRFLRENPQFAGDSKDMGELQQISDYVKILNLQYEELYQGLELLELRNEAARLQTRLIEQYVKTEKHQLATAMRQAGDKDVAKLLEKAKELDLLLKGGGV